jgi:hypothetical protein
MQGSVKNQPKAFRRPSAELYNVMVLAQGVEP